MTYQCPDCKNEFMQPFRCTTCGAEKLFDATVISLQERNDALAARLAAAEAVAAADGTLHSAIDHWQSRALTAEARLAEAERLLNDAITPSKQWDGIADAIEIFLRAASSAEVAPKPGVCRHCGQYLDRRGKCRNPEHNS